MLRMTRWIVDHRITVLVSWVVVALGVFAASAIVGERTSNNFSLPDTESQAAFDLLEDRFPTRAGDSGQIVFHSIDGRITDASVREIVVPLLETVGGMPHVTSVVSPYEAGAGAVSEDGTIGFATVTFDTPAFEVDVAAVKNVIETAQGVRTDALDIELGGAPIEQAEESAIGPITLIGLAAAIIVLLVVFGSFAAMSLPIVTALFGLAAGLGLIGLLSHVIDMADFSSQLALMIGLGVGIDYALFIVTRYREAFGDNGGNVRASVEVALNTAGRAIVFAGITVVIALMGLFALGVSFLYGVAIASSIGVLLVLFASVTLLPALLTFFGSRVGKVTAPRRPPTRAGFLTRWVDAIQRRPVAATVIATAIMALLALPTLGLRLGQSDAGNRPEGDTAREAYDLLASGFGDGVNGPLQLAVTLPSDGSREGLEELTTTLEATPNVASVAAPQLNPVGDTALIAVYPETSPQSEETTNLVKHLRADVIPPVASSTGQAVYVGGSTASGIDFADALSGKIFLFVGLVIGLSAILLAVVFRSFVIPVQAALMNLLSIVAALGVVQAVFQQGWAGSLIGVEAGPIEAFIPVFLFAIVFGLSMDYEVFLVSRIHEEWAHGKNNLQAIRAGVISTGRVITAAAAVMIVVFASFAGTDARVLKLFGIALATAVFLDAFLIRMILLPAVLQLTGRYTWAFPGWLDRRLPRLAIEPGDDEAQPAKMAPPSLERAA